MYKLGFYVPEQALEKVKSALFEVGAGHSGNYDLCCWQTLGKSQFRPLPRSQPTIGKEEKLSILDEYRVEMICEDLCFVMHKQHCTPLDMSLESL